MININYNNIYTIYSIRVHRNIILMRVRARINGVCFFVVFFYFLTLYNIAEVQGDVQGERQRRSDIDDDVTALEA